MTEREGLMEARQDILSSEGIRLLERKPEAVAAISETVDKARAMVAEVSTNGDEIRARELAVFHLGSLEMLYQLALAKFEEEARAGRIRKQDEVETLRTGLNNIAELLESAKDGFRVNFDVKKGFFYNARLWKNMASLGFVTIHLAGGWQRDVGPECQMVTTETSLRFHNPGAKNIGMYDRIVRRLSAWQEELLGPESLPGMNGAKQSRNFGCRLPGNFTTLDDYIKMNEIFERLTEKEDQQ